MFFDLLDLFSLGLDAILLEDGRIHPHSSITGSRTAGHRLMRMKVYHHTDV